MQDNFSIHSWRLNKAINEVEEKKLCKECGTGYMEEGQCMECGYMEEAIFTSKHDDNPELKGDQKDLPDELQAKILNKEGHSSLSHVEEMEAIIDNLVRNISTDSTIPTTSKIGLLRAFKELKGHIEDLGAEIEMDGLNESKEDILGDRILDMLKSGKSKEEVLQILKQIVNQEFHELEPAVKTTDIEDSDMIAEATSNPEGDKLVLRFLQGIAKKFDYPVSHAVMFVKERIKSLGY